MRKLNIKSKMYYTFVLGYDLLHEELNNLECDTAFEICYKVIELFENSKEINNLDLSCYEALQEFIKNKKELINSIIRGVVL